MTDTATGKARQWQWTYTNQGLAQTMTDPKGATWRYGWDAQGNRASVSDPLGHTTQYTHDAAGRVVSQTQPDGLVTTYTYDPRGRVTALSRGGEATRLEYTPVGKVSLVTLPDGYRMAYSYDAAQRLTSASDNRGATVKYTLDAMGNEVTAQVLDANGNIALASTRLINGLNQLVAVQDAQGASTTFGYDANGERVSESDALQQTTRQTLDALRRSTATTFADNSHSSQSWTALDSLQAFSDPKGVATHYSINAFGEVTREQSPDSGTTVYSRDAAGKVVAVTDASGNESSIERDALGRATQVRYADQTQGFSYDAQGELSRIDDGSGTTSFTRDALGRVVSKTQTVDDVTGNPSHYTVQYGWAAGDLASVTYPSGLQVNYLRTAGRVTGIDVQLPAIGQRASTVVPFITNLTHTALGQPRNWSWFKRLPAASTRTAAWQRAKSRATPTTRRGA